MSMFGNPFTRRSFLKRTGFVAAGAVAAGLFTTTAMPKEAKAFGWQDDRDPNQDYIDAGQELSRRILGEGAVLMKNSGILPLEQGSKVTILGAMSYNYVLGGTGSAGGKDDEFTVMMNDAFTGVGLDVNPDGWAALEEACGGARGVN